MALGPGWTGNCCRYWQSFISFATLAVSVSPLVAWMDIDVSKNLISMLVAGTLCLESRYLDAN